MRGDTTSIRNKWIFLQMWFPGSLWRRAMPQMRDRRWCLTSIANHSPWETNTQCLEGASWQPNRRTFWSEEDIGKSTRIVLLDWLRQACRRLVSVLQHLCSKERADKGKKWRKRLFNTGVPFERIALGITGPFLITRRGNQYILMIMDYLTKWPEALPITDQIRRWKVADALI